MEKKVKKYIIEQKLIVAGDRVLIGVSGGADSLALLFFLDKYAKEFELSIGVGHLHHNMRGLAADEDEAFVRGFCEKRGIPFYSRKRSIFEIAAKERISVEEAGRNERYDFLWKIVREEGYNRLAMGHHIDDQAETMLMRLIRGTGIKGVSGIKSGNNKKLIRPFLCLEKSEILSYCQKYKLEYRNDATNLQRDYTRNKIRLDILPKICEINPKAAIHFNEFTKIAGEYEGFFEEYVDTIENLIIESKDCGVSLNIEAWLLEKPVVQKELLRRGIYKFKGSLKEIEYNHIIALFTLIKSSKTVWEFHLPNEMMALRKYERLFFVKRKKEEANSIGTRKLILDKTWIFPKMRLLIKTEIIRDAKKLSNPVIFPQILKNHSEKYFDYDKIQEELFLRNRQTGDYFYPVGVQGKKTIKKYFIDKKINRDLRENIPLIVSGSEVLWIIGYGINERLLAQTETQNILKVEVTLC
ncbi:MAG: tRNA lysidine(34) synthetase TilS [Eubacteriaceae bacterium]